MVNMKITIERQNDCWSFSTLEAGTHLGYPDPYRALAAAMDSYDLRIERTDVLVSDIATELSTNKPKFALHVVKQEGN